MTGPAQHLITLAHQGGWDETGAAVLGPLLVIGVLAFVAARRGSAGGDRHDDDFDD